MPRGFLGDPMRDTNEISLLKINDTPSKKNPGAHLPPRPKQNLTMDPALKKQIMEL